MATAACVVCGSINLVMDDGLFVCQDCECKYTVEQVRNLMTNQEVSVSEQQPSPAADYRELAQRALDINDLSTAAEMFDKAVEADPDDYNSSWMATLTRAYMGSVSTRSLSVRLREPLSRLRNAIGGFGEQYFLAATVLLSTLDDYTSTFSSEFDEQMRKIEYDIAVSDTYGKIRALEEKQRLLARQMTQVEGAMRMQIEAHDEVLAGVVDPFCVPEAYLSRCEHFVSLIKEAIDVNVIDEMPNLTRVRVMRKRYPRGGDAYWDEHPAERLKLFEEISELETSKKELEKRVSAADDKAKQIKSSPKKAAPSKARLDRLESELADLEKRHDSLGFFRKKEKEAVSASIDSKKAEIESTKLQVKRQLQEIEEKHAERTQAALDRNEQAIVGDRKQLEQVKRDLSALSHKLSTHGA